MHPKGCDTVIQRHRIGIQNLYNKFYWHSIHTNMFLQPVLTGMSILNINWHFQWWPWLSASGRSGITSPVSKMVSPWKTYTHKESVHENIHKHKNERLFEGNLQKSFTVWNKYTYRKQSGFKSNNSIRHFLWKQEISIWTWNLGMTMISQSTKIFGVTFYLQPLYT